MRITRKLKRDSEEFVRAHWRGLVCNVKLYALRNGLGEFRLAVEWRDPEDRHLVLVRKRHYGGDSYLMWGLADQTPVSEVARFNDDRTARIVGQAYAARKARQMWREA